MNFMANATYPAVRHIAVGNRFIALWDTVIGKKVVMAVTGAVLILFVIAHMVGNLKIFSGPNEINAYSRFLREVGSPALAMGNCYGWFESSCWHVWPFTSPPRSSSAA